MTYRSTTLRTTLFDRPSVLTRSSLFRASRTARRSGTSATLGRLAARQSAGLPAKASNLSAMARELADQSERAAHSAARTAQNAAGRARDEARRQDWRASLPDDDPRRLRQQVEQRGQQVEQRVRQEAEQRARNAADQAFRSGPGQAVNRTYAQSEALRRRYEESRGARRLASVAALLVPVVVMAIFIWLLWS